tara:strand:+ start:230 stop:409 length:180 start_codon:yes stop_codon:yes gene_type:complete
VPNVLTTDSQPVTVSDDAATLQIAFDGAAKKMAHLLETTLGQLHHHKGGASIRHEDIIE